ncbi:MAG: hypothetical protein N2036_09830 [Bryobacteraceae bacterium]|nr:hypothetical protein [Bryobacteraceae bacterium]MCX7604361.1 hypothetical protein [Bryobacteraceae bacterium]
MKKLALGLLMSAAAALAGEWTGYVSEDKCGAKHQSGSPADVSCVKACIKGGAKPVLVTDGKVVPIANPDKVPESLYGLKAKVSGELKDGRLQIASIQKAD